MNYAQRLILHAPRWDSPALKDFVKACISDGVILICVVGPDCEKVEDVIDELVVGEGSDPTSFINTTSHPNASVAEVMAFAKAWTLDVDPALDVQEVHLPIH